MWSQTTPNSSKSDSNPIFRYHFGEDGKIVELTCVHLGYTLQRPWFRHFPTISDNLRNVAKIFQNYVVKPVWGRGSFLHLLRLEMRWKHKNVLRFPTSHTTIPQYKKYKQYKKDNSKYNTHYNNKYNKKTQSLRKPSYFLGKFPHTRTFKEAQETSMQIQRKNAKWKLNEHTR